ncbi:MAG: bifunctional phosphoribosyl-AMP cyclohydrolase/phosphoribosyl-ATP diphosphatase HisIE [Lachnospiraceae bacterium]|nr:bifunctional phosphoribosyl-AMP cyclohydrolase/phosphoribosyl-ATP diphosphatase HisIE [Lachnospiraceae bacterium]
MDYTKIIPKLSLENPIEMAEYYNDCGADEIAYFDSTATKEGREPDIQLIKDITRKIDVPLLVCGGIHNLEDAKKVLYAGAAKVCIKSAAISNPDIIKEIAERFGSDRLIVTVDLEEKDAVSWAQKVQSLGAGQLLLIGSEREHYVATVKEVMDKVKIPVMVSIPYDTDANVVALLEETKAQAVSLYTEEYVDIMELKQECALNHIEVNTYESELDFDSFKVDENGLIPTVVQHYKTGEVLMLAYMNKESFEKTIATGRMTYYSRSRQQLWTKGETSGHFQFVKALTIDCDKDTILAKVSQIGPACHTGSPTCFFTDLVRKEYDDTNPLTVFEDEYNIIMDRKANPREGSYTNYLFDKGIDKILKKVGEEATEIVIAAKNPDAEELKYEISDFLYHVMVLMVERGVTWKDITDELAERR